MRPRVAPSTHVHNVGSIEGSRRSLFPRFDPILTSALPFLSIVSAVKTADRTGLLLDISDFFQRNKYSIIEAEVSTTTHDSMASDIFLVQQADGRKIQKPRQFAEEIRDVILKSNRAHRSNSTTPGTSRSSSRAPSRDPSAHGGAQFYSRGDGGPNEGQARDLIKRATGSLVQHGDGKNIDGDGKLVEGESMNGESMNANGISEAEVTANEDARRVAGLEVLE